MFKKILVAVDGSPSSKHAAEVAIELAAKNKASLDVVGVILFADDADAHVAFLKERKWFSKAVGDVVVKAKRKRVRANPFVLGGAAEEVLVNLARKQKNDLVVVGYWGSATGGDIARIALGNIHNALLKAPRVPLLVVK